MSKVVIVNYKFNDAFKIPKNIDLEDETVVKGWWVKWNTLHILFVDGTEKEIESEGWTNDLEFKEPNEDPVIENAEDWNLEDDEEEEEHTSYQAPVDTPIISEPTISEPVKKVVVSRILINEILYLWDKHTNIVYDPVEHIPVGVWNYRTKKIEPCKEEDDDDDDDEEIDEKRLQEHKDALQLAEWRKNLPSKAVCDYLDKNLPGWREEPKDEI